MTKFQLTVISPEKTILEAECLSVTLPTVDGEITVLPGHMAIFSILKPGEVTAKTDKEVISMVVGGGFVNVNGDRVTILAEFGAKSDEINEEKVRDAKKRAEEILSARADEQSSALAQATLARSLLELKISRKRRKAI